LKSVFGTLHRSNDAVANALSVVSGDKEFVERMACEGLSSPSNAIDGLSQCGRSVALGFSEAVFGFFIQPARGLRDGGAMGLFKGVAKGVTGLVTKPVAGLFKGISQTSEVVTSVTPGSS
jgi:vacuolar protein sorting-associated protein 13A/C